jgi:ferredoxin
MMNTSNTFCAASCLLYPIATRHNKSTTTFRFFPSQLTITMTRSSTQSLLLLAVLAATSVESFNVAPRSVPQLPSTTSLDMFGGLKGAFANDDSLGKRQSEGLSGGPNYNENVTVNGQLVKGAVVGQKITVVAGRVRVKIPVNCQKGDCGTCIVNMNGKKVKACQATVPTGKCTVTTL